MEKSGTDLEGRVVNALIEPVADCSELQATAAGLMLDPETARLKALEDAGLVFVPFPEIGVLRHAHDIFDGWAKFFSWGVYLLEDHPYGEADQPEPSRRYLNCCRLRFHEAAAFANSGLVGRFFLWIDRPQVFLTTSFSEFSGFGCPPDRVQTTFGMPLRALVDEFTAYATAISDDDGGRFYRRLAGHYESQWALQ